MSDAVTATAPSGPRPGSRQGHRPVWVLIGASSAIARAAGRRLAAAGADIILAGRDAEDLEIQASDLRIRGTGRAAVLLVDTAITAGDDASGMLAHDRLVAEITAWAGPEARINLFVAAGSMPTQEAMDADPDLALHTLRAGFDGVVSILHRLAPELERRGWAQVIVLGSVAGDRGRLKNYVYGAAKGGLATYLQGLRARLHPSHGSVTTIKPGFVDTAMTFGLPGMFLVAQPDDVAEIAIRTSAYRRATVYAPWFWKWIMLIIRLIPEPIFLRLNI